jgi:hypothetical protein
MTLMQPPSMTGFGGAAGNWFALRGGLFPQHDWYVVPSIEEAGLFQCHDVGEAFAEMGNALSANIAATPIDIFAELYPGRARARWEEIARGHEVAR